MRGEMGKVKEGWEGKRRSLPKLQSKSAYADETGIPVIFTVASDQSYFRETVFC